MGLYNSSLGLQGSFSLTPAPTKTLFAGNYLTFDNATGGGTFAKQFLPDVYEQEVERYGNRSVSSFLRMVGAEEPSQSDQIIWSEQGRLHLAYKGVAFNSNAATEKTINITGHSIRLYQTVVISTGILSEKAIVTGIAPDSITVQPYKNTNFSVILPATHSTTAVLNVFVYGSEWGKGSDIPSTYGSVEAGFQQFSNSPIILRDQYSISGSDASQIGWVEVTTENGASGYLWYLKSEHEARLRFEDYLEMSLMEGELSSSNATTAFNTATSSAFSLKGTQGMFSAIETRGNVYQNFASGESTLSNAGANRSSLEDFDEILKNLDKQGAIEENMLFLNRSMSLNFDNMLAAVTVNAVGGTSYGVFDNAEDMALNLGFSGFRRGSYDFYKTDWKYLNDAGARGLSGDITGVLVPAGTSTVYDQSLGKNIKRPFLHVRYRSSEADDRKMKSWITGSVGGASNSTLDKMQVNFLSERCLIVQGANNFVLFKAATQTA
jgi:hypothetical protein